MTFRCVFSEQNICFYLAIWFALVGYLLKKQNSPKNLFSEEENRQGRDAQIGLQAGYNEGASQAGQNIGKKRSIMDWGFL